MLWYFGAKKLSSASDGFISPATVIVIRERWVFWTVLHLTGIRRRMILKLVRCLAILPMSTTVIPPIRLILLELSMLLLIDLSGGEYVFNLFLSLTLTLTLTHKYDCFFVYSMCLLFIYCLSSLSLSICLFLIYLISGFTDCCCDFYLWIV